MESMLLEEYKTLSLFEKINHAKKFHRLFQGLVIILANYRCGVKIDENYKPNLIFKYEGGAEVNENDIVITYDTYTNQIYCYDDFKFNDIHRKESDITQTVVNDLLEKINWTSQTTIQTQIEELVYLETGLTEVSLTKILNRFISNPFGDPLRSLFDN